MTKILCEKAQNVLRTLSKERLDISQIDYNEKYDLIGKSAIMDNIMCLHREMPTSPIEQIFAVLLCFSIDGYSNLLWHNPLKDKSQDASYIVPQAKIGKYYLDFAILMNYMGNDRIIGFECDGHDFHHGNKQQVQKDKIRDRFLTSKGVKLYRFSGSEIYKFPFSVLGEMELYLANESFDLIGV